jgi:multimeric flavodoxin WrbA
MKQSLHIIRQNDRETLCSPIQTRIQTRIQTTLLPRTGETLNPKILIVLGSPRKNGNSAALSAQLAQSAANAGADVETIYLNALNIKPCQGCEKCQAESATGCVIQDDMTPLYPKLHQADSLVIASPVYWFNFSAQTKIFIDRLFAVGVGTRNIFKGKSTALILTYADPDPFAAGAVNALRAFQDMCKYLNANIEGIVYGSAWGAGEIKDKPEVMEKAAALGKHLASIRTQQT